MRISKSVMAVGGVVLAAAVIGFTNPKAVHAVTAALVQITNTASNPAVTQSVGRQAGNMVHLECDVIMDGNGVPCYLIVPNGTATGYTVPAGESLVVTAIDTAPQPPTICPTNYLIVVGNSLRLSTGNSLVTTHLTYPSGPVIGSGNTLIVYGFAEISTSSSSPSCIGHDDVNIFGYLTAS